MYLLQEANIALVDGIGFGAPKCIRISYATSEEQLSIAMERLTEALSKLGQ
jgi:aspartate aminotransferase